MKRIISVIILFTCSLGFAQDIPELKFEKITLSNGLDVILHEDHSTPMVSVNLWYHVGSKNEKRGRTGFAHLFEHLMFEGSENAPEGMFDKWLESVGGDNNGSTSEDRTNYWENVPSNALELALFLEADRMANLLPAVTQKKLDGQRDVVKNEKRQTVDNQPYGLVGELQVEYLYPDDHPYSHSVIGSMDDLTAASVEDVHEFFKTYYTPNNASLSIAGDINPEETKKLVEKYFGSIPPGPPVARLERWVPELETSIEVDMKDKVSLPRIYMSWHSPAYYDEGDGELDILASILTGGKNSRLYKSLVYDKQIAQDVTSYQSSGEIAGNFNIIATAKQGHSLSELQGAIDEIMKKLISEGPDQKEVQTAINSWESAFVRRIQSIGGFGGKADLLNKYNVYRGTPDYIEKDMGRYLNATPESVREIAAKYLDPGKRLIIRVEPEGDLKAAEDVKIDWTKRPETGEAPELTLPEFEERTLSNGLKVVIAEHHELPLVQFNLQIEAGWANDPSGKPGVSSLMSDLQDEGTKNRSALEIAQDLKEIGAGLGSSSSFDGSSVTLNTLKKQLDKALEIYADVIINPTFPDEELARKKQQYLGRIMQEKRQPFTVSIKNFMKILYGSDHPYGQPYTGTGTEESIEKISRGDLEKFYKKWILPNNARLIVAGDITADEIIPKLEKALKDWEKGAAPETNVPATDKLDNSLVYIIDNPGAAQSAIVIGHQGALRNAPDYYQTSVMNTILGGKFTSRLNSNLREDKGYTYGAGSFFMYMKGVGPFMAYSQVQSEYTKESLVEFVKELNGLAGDLPVGDEELRDTKNYITLRFPREFETISQIAGKISNIYTYNLPEDYYASYVSKIEDVTADEIAEAAEKYIRPDKMLYVIVGDAKSIEAGVRELNLGEVHVIDLDGNPVK